MSRMGVLLDEEPLYALRLASGRKTCLLLQYCRWNQTDHDEFLWHDFVVDIFIDLSGDAPRPRRTETACIRSASYDILRNHTIRAAVPNGVRSPLIPWPGQIRFPLSKQCIYATIVRAS